VAEKGDRVGRRLRSNVNAYYSIPHPDSIVARSFADLAIQHRLGLLSKRRARIDSVDRNNSRRNGATLIGQRTVLGSALALRGERLFQRVGRLARPAAGVRMREVAQLVPLDSGIVGKRIHRHSSTGAAALQMSM
jgi:hypothetical protein